MTLMYMYNNDYVLYFLVDCKSIHYFASGLYIPPNTTEQNLACTWIMVMIRLTLRALWFLEGMILVLAMQTSMTESTNQELFWIQVSSLPHEKHQLLKIWADLKFRKISEKARSTVISRAIQRVILIPNTQEYPDFQDISTKYQYVCRHWGWLSGVMHQHFKRLGPQRE